MELIFSLALFLPLIISLIVSEDIRDFAMEFAGITFVALCTVLGTTGLISVILKYGA